MATFPNISNKHSHDTLVEPSDLIDYIKKEDKLEIPKDIPKYLIMNYQSSLGDYVSQKENFIKNDVLSRIVGGDFYISKNNKVGFVTNFGIGSPVAAAVLEECIVFGFKMVFNIGTAGSLQKDGKVGDIILCEKAIRDEGVSHHYIKTEKYSHASEKLTDELERYFKKKDRPYTKGAAWTIDAPYRETIEEAKQYQEEGVLAVEMEAAALFAVAKHRNIEIASAFSVSDLLGEFEWTPAFGDDKTGQGLEFLFDTIVELVNE